VCVCVCVCVSLYFAFQLLSRPSDLYETWYDCYSVEGHFNMVDARVSVQGVYVIHTNILLKLMQLYSGVYSVGYEITNGRAVGLIVIVNDLLKVRQEMS
jgi:hypothetical protein